MKKTIVIILLSLMAAALPGSLPAVERVPFLDLPNVDTRVLGNGIKVFSIKDELPVFTAVVAIGYGQLYETRETAGMADLLANTLAFSGSSKYPGRSLYDTIESAGASLSINASYEETTITIRVLQRYADTAYAVLGDLLANPAFGAEGFATAMGIVTDKVRRQFDDPATIGFLKVREIIFDGTGYGAIPTEAQLRGYTLAQVRDAWTNAAVGGNIRVGIASQAPAAEVLQASRDAFSMVPAGAKRSYAVDTPRLRELLRKNRGKIFWYRKDIPQATLVSGTLAPPIADEGIYALTLMDYILGGGSFNSRLMAEIRVKRGLAYVVQSVLRPRAATGVFLTFVQTDPAAAGTVQGLVMDNCAAMAATGVTPEELAWARDSINNSYVFQFDTLQNILSNYLSLDFYNLPADYYERYLERINAVDAAAIRDRSAKLFEDGMITVAVGNDRMKDALAGSGEVVLLNP